VMLARHGETQRGSTDEETHDQNQADPTPTRRQRPWVEQWRQTVQPAHGCPSGAT
jgi:hypothetical protein